MNYQYLAATKEVSAALLDDWHEARKPYVAMCDEIKADAGAFCFYGDGGLPQKLVFDDEEKMPSYMLGPMAMRCEGKTVYVSRPGLRSKAGRDMAERLRAACELDREVCDFGDYLLSRYGLHRHVAGGMAKDQAVFRIPVSDTEPAIEPPSGFTEIKKSEFVALTEE